MKTRNAMLFSLLVLPFSVSCGKGETDARVRLGKIEGLDSTIRIHSEKELTDITRYDDCMLYVSLEGCHYCAETKGRLKNYIQKNQVMVYEVDRSVYASAYDSTTNQEGRYAFLYPKISAFPAFFFYKNGKLVNSHLDSLSDEKTTEDFFAEYTIPTENYCLNDIEYSKREDSYSFLTSESDEKTKDQILLGFTDKTLSKAIENPITVLFTWRRCSDCEAYANYVLLPFRKENQVGKIYYYETDGFMQLKRMEGELGDYGLTLWSDFSIRYHLDTYPNIDRNGNASGFTPSIVSFQKDGYRFSVFSNYQNPKRNNDGTLSFSKAYYPEILALTSKKKVKEGDTTSDNYQKAFKELTERATEIDAELNIEFLKENIHE